jgi:hypothetical protein
MSCRLLPVIGLTNVMAAIARLTEGHETPLRTGPFKATFSA